MTWRMFSVILQTVCAASVKQKSRTPEPSNSSNLGPQLGKYFKLNSDTPLSGMFLGLGIEDKKSGGFEVGKPIGGTP